LVINKSEKPRQFGLGIGFATGATGRAFVIPPNAQISAGPTVAFRAEGSEIPLLGIEAVA
jgi:hypothetical protein